VHVHYAIHGQSVPCCKLINGSNRVPSKRDLPAGAVCLLQHVPYVPTGNLCRVTRSLSRLGDCDNAPGDPKSHSNKGDINTRFLPSYAPIEGFILRTFLLFFWLLRKFPNVVRFAYWPNAPFRNSRHFFLVSAFRSRCPSILASTNANRLKYINRRCETFEENQQLCINHPSSYYFRGSNCFVMTRASHLEAVG